MRTRCSNRYLPRVEILEQRFAPNEVGLSFSIEYGLESDARVLSGAHLCQSASPTNDSECSRGSREGSAKPDVEPRNELDERYFIDVPRRVPADSGVGRNLVDSWFDSALMPTLVNEDTTTQISVRASAPGGPSAGMLAKATVDSASYLSAPPAQSNRVSPTGLLHGEHEPSRLSELIRVISMARVITAAGAMRGPSNASNLDLTTQSGLSQPIDDGTGATSSPITDFQGNGITASDNLWWFDGAQPTYYRVIIGLTAIDSNPYGNTYEWTVTSGTSIVDFENHSDSYTGVNRNYVQLLSTSSSTAMFDVSIQVKRNGLLYGGAVLWVPRPSRLVHLRNDDQPDAMSGYKSEIHYRIEDQFNRVLPRRVEINEKWTSNVVADFPGTTWSRPAEGSATVNPADWADRVSGPPIALGPNPVPQNPQNPLGNTKVIHWDGEWYVGSLVIGMGVKVQTNTWQSYRDHARHENVVSPP